MASTTLSASEQRLKQQPMHIGQILLFGVQILEHHLLRRLMHDDHASNVVLQESSPLLNGSNFLLLPLIMAWASNKASGWGTGTTEPEEAHYLHCSKSKCKLHPSTTLENAISNPAHQEPPDLLFASALATSSNTWSGSLTTHRRRKTLYRTQAGWFV